MSRHDYEPFGEELFVGRTGEHKGDGIKQQFTGQERDLETRLDYFDARYYSYTHGRFTSTDPLRESAKPAESEFVISRKRVTDASITFCTDSKAPIQG